jgi:uncharacterized Zn-finger protein
MSSCYSSRDLYIWAKSSNVQSVIIKQLRNVILLLIKRSLHMGQKFQCPECDYQATRKGDLVTHRRSVHMGQKFSCPECDYQSTQKSSLVAHKKSMHMSQKFQCEYQTNWKQVLVVHLHKEK